MKTAKRFMRIIKSRLDRSKNLPIKEMLVLILYRLGLGVPENEAQAK